MRSVDETDAQFVRRSMPPTRARRAQRKTLGLYPSVSIGVIGCTFDLPFVRRP
jgi:hypothetical protein